VLSAARDGEAAPDEAAARAHLAGCAECQAHVAAWDRVHRELGGDTAAPDLVAGVLDRIAAAPSRRRRLVPLVAAAVAGVLVGATLVSSRPGRGPELVGADIPRRVLAAQSRLDSLSARIEITERGWHPDVPVRHYTGTLAYAAPESIALHLDDRTRYPAGAWVPNDVDVVVAGSRWWARGPAACPSEAQPQCTPAAPRVRVITGREPFADDLAAPLDLVLPASGFAVGDTATVLDKTRRFDGRAATGVVTTAAQLSALLDTVRLAGNWRAVAPTDGVTVWLDRVTQVPLQVDVGDRLQIRMRDVVVNGPVASDAFPPAPPAPVVRDAGFVDGPVADALAPAWLPPGMRPYRTGHSGPIAAASWSDGRAWVKVRWTTSWPGGRLFGGVGDVVRPVPLDGHGTAYASEGGRAIAVHAEGIDAVVTGSVPSAELTRVAASLGLRGRQVPADWAEASTATLASAKAALTPLLVLGGSTAFAAPAIRVEDGTVTMAYAGAGDRGFVLAQRAGAGLAPPLDAEVDGVRVRGRLGRWTPSVHALEWVEGSHVVELRSRTLRLAELLDIARDLRRAP
jgi:hypothetical protein